MLGAEHPLAVGEQRLVDRDRVVNTARRLVGSGEVVAGRERVGVLGAQDPLAVGEQRLEDRDRVVDAPRRLVGAGEVVAGLERVGVLGAEDALAVGSSGSKIAIASPMRPAAL